MTDEIRDHELATMRDDECFVYWALAGSPRHSDLTLLSPRELARAKALTRFDARLRFITATNLARQVAAAATRVSPDCVELDRNCVWCGATHGRPTLPGTGLHISIAHSDGLVGVALTYSGPVGLDVEQRVVRPFRRLTRVLLACGEHVDCPADFYAHWTRKEAVVKATGDGLAAGLDGVVVSRPDQLARLISYRGRPGLRAQLTDLSARNGYAACVAVLSARPLRVMERSADEAGNSRS